MRLCFSASARLGHDSGKSGELSRNLKKANPEGLFTSAIIRKKSPGRAPVTVTLSGLLIIRLKSKCFFISSCVVNRIKKISLRVFNSIQAHGLNICRGFFTGGESIINYLKSLDIDLYLTANDDSARAAIDNGIPAATMITSAAKYMTETTELRVAFDGDAVLFGDESEAVFKSEGLEAFGKSESEKANIPMKEGPMAKFLRALSKIQTKQEKEGKENETKIVTALVTARSAPAHARTIKTLRAWGIKVNQAFFLGGLDKTYVLKEFKPQIFFDDQHVHTDRASLVVPAGTVPYKSDSVLAQPKEEEKKGEKEC